jgi:hypothetical protein
MSRFSIPSYAAFDATSSGRLPLPAGALHDEISRSPTAAIRRPPDRSRPFVHIDNSFWATPAQAVDCAGPSERPNGDGYLVTFASIALKRGPYGACGTISHIPPDRGFWIHCNFVNNYGNWWVYGRVGGTSTYGWVYINGDVELKYKDEDGDGYIDQTYAVCE